MNTKLIKAIMGLVAVLLLVVACDHIPALSGSGNLIRETREISGFEAVELNSVGSMEIVQDGTESVVIETDDDVMKHITTEVRDKTLYVGRDSISPTPTKVNITLHVNKLTNLSVAGTWDVRSDSLESDSLGIKIDGTSSIRIKRLIADELAVIFGGVGDVEIAGEVTSQTIVVNGIGAYRAGGLKSETSSISVSGSGEFTLSVTKTLDMKVEGSCIVDYYGNPVIRIGQSAACEIRNIGNEQ